MNNNLYRIKNYILNHGNIKFISDCIKTVTPSKAFIELGQQKIKLDKFYKLQKEFGKHMKIYQIKEPVEYSKRIWTIWFQGQDKAPDIVKACWSSIDRHLCDFDFNIISYDNVKDFIQIPKYITDKYRDGLIGLAHLSDIIRTKLLVEYGGLWLDATVMCSNNTLMKMIKHEKLDLFVYQNIDSIDLTSVLSNWLIYSSKGNPILRSVYDLLMEYWMEHDKPIDYFFYHMLFTIVVNNYRDEWEKMPVYPNSYSHLIQKQLFEPYNKYRYDILCSLASFHKLTYKFDSQKTKLQDTFYMHIISENTVMNSF